MQNYGIAGWSVLLMWMVALSGFIGLYLRGYLTEDIKFRRERLGDFHGRIEELRSSFLNRGDVAAASNLQPANAR